MTITATSGTAMIDSASSSFQALLMEETESMNIESAVVVRELPILRSVRKASERIKHWSHLDDIPVEEIEGEVPVLIGCDVPEAHGFWNRGWMAERARRLRAPWWEG